MKNSKTYAKKVQKLYQDLKRKHQTSKKVSYEDPLDALIYAIVSHDLNSAKAESTIKKFSDYFVDWNDLRVSLVLEITEVLGDDTDITKNTAETLIAALASVFNKYNITTLMSLKKMGKRPARQALEQIADINVFVVDYCMLTSLQGHAIPLTDRMIDYLKSTEIVHPEADYAEIEGFLARQIPAQKAYEFYALLRKESETATRKKTKTKKTEKAVPKTKEKVEKVKKKTTKKIKKRTKQKTKK